jgi:S-adenosylmethionine:tRNA ribosyltransferase-isomerase
LPANCTVLISIDNIKPSDYSYELPDYRIAAFPAHRRDISRLLIRQANGIILEDLFQNIARYLPEGSRIFFNNSKVISARIIFRTKSGSKVEIFCLRPVNPSDYSLALSSSGSCIWECMIGNVKRFKEPFLQMPVTTSNRDLILTAEKTEIKGNMAVIKFKWDDAGITFAEIISVAGLTPLPPYLKRDPVPEDRYRYQTIYSKNEGSVAAPTAGLHFTNEVLDSLTARNIARHEVTLHVGAGTFLPVKTEYVRDHKMHAEYFEVSAGIVDELAGITDRVTCVGTTTVRTLESLYWLGAKIAADSECCNELNLGQWEPYSIKECPKDIAFGALSKWLTNNTEKTLASTSFMIVPGYKFKVTDRLITNFHQPGSTLLMLIAAFIGESWKETYNYALEKGFRFLSFGDSSLLINADTDSGQQ